MIELILVNKEHGVHSDSSLDKSRLESTIVTRRTERSHSVRVKCIADVDAT